MPTHAQPWDMGSMDFIMELPMSKVHNALMVVVIYFSKQAFYPC